MYLSMPIVNTQIYITFMGLFSNLKFTTTNLITQIEPSGTHEKYCNRKDEKFYIASQDRNFYSLQVSSIYNRKWNKLFFDQI